MSKTQKLYKLAFFILMSGFVTASVGSNLAQDRQPIGVQGMLLGVR